MFSLVQLVAPAFEPVTVSEAKTWLNFDSSEQDALILGLIASAREYVEMFTRRALITQTFELSFDHFPGRGVALGQQPRIFETRSPNLLYPGEDLKLLTSRREIILPRPPLVSVESLKYYDEAGALQTMSTAQYFVDQRREPGRIVLNSNFDWPDTDQRPNAVIIAFTAGFGTPSRVPASIRTAIRFMVTHWFSQRTPVETGLRAAAVEVPKTVDALLWQNRIPSFF